MNKSEKKVAMPTLDKAGRSRNFEEVAIGYTADMAREEAERCIGCKNAPCISGCPVGVKIPEFIALIAAGDFEGAKAKIEETNSLGSVCGRVCPQEEQCQKVCVRGIKGESVAIGRLERFACDFAEDFVPSESLRPLAYNLHAMESQTSPMQQNQDSRQILNCAIVGSGPAGLACAGELAKNGWDVTIFEALHEVGGVLIYGIPEFRLPKSVVRAQADKLRDMGVKIETNVVIGKTITLDELREEFDAVFIGSGAGLPNFMRLDGENLNGVYSANEFLTRINLMKANKFPENDTPIKVGEKVAVIGGGNVAMDAARCARRMGADVRLVYRRMQADMPARLEEVEHALEEGIDILELASPTKILGNEEGRVCGLEIIRTEMGEMDEKGRRSFNMVADSEETVEVQTVIMAIGTRPNPLIAKTTEGLEINKRGGIIVKNDAGLTSLDNVYAGGDAVTGAATVILAMGAGREAAREIMSLAGEKSCL